MDLIFKINELCVPQLSNESNDRLISHIFSFQSGGVLFHLPLLIW